MLVIARRVGEALRIGGDVTIRVQQIQGKRVRLSVSAPSSVLVTRVELEACSSESIPVGAESSRGQ